MRAVFVLAFFLLAFESSAQEPIRIQIGGEPATLDPAQVADQYGNGILRNMMLGLMGLDSDGLLIKGLAENYRVSKNGLQYDFKLKANAKWSDGKPVQLEEFILAFRHLFTPKTAAPNVEHFFALKNGRSVFEGKKPVTELGVFKFKDGLRFELERADPLFLLALTTPAAAPRRSVEFDVKGPVTGDYLVKTFAQGELIELLPNPLGLKKGSFPIQYRILREETTGLNLFEAGKLDVVTAIPANDLLRLKEKGVVQSFASTTVFYISFNVSKPPFNDRAMRQAVAANIDREGLSKALNGVFVPSYSYVPQSLLGDTNDFYSRRKKLNGVSPDNKLGKPAGLTEGARVLFSFGASAFTKTVTEKLQYDLKKSFGLNVELDPQELKVLLGRLRGDPPSMYLLGMSAMFNDPVNHLEAFSSLAQPNFSRYQNQKFEDLLLKLRGTAEPLERKKLALKLDEILVSDDIVVVPIVLRSQVFAVSKAIKNFFVNPYQVIPLSDLKKELK